MKYVLIVIIIVVLLGGGYFLMKGNSQTQQSSIQATSTTVTQSNQQSSPTASATAQQSGTKASVNAVSYTSNGFEPHSITIKSGQTVTWTNKSSDDVWVASNPHPTHTDYPGFDELKSMSNGQTYSFTFTKVGNWGYHNHLNPSQMGVVVVAQ